MHFQTFEPTQTQLRMVQTAGQSGNVCAVFRLQGEVDEARLARAVREVVHRTAPFSYRFMRLNQSMQIVVPQDSLGGTGLALDGWSVVDVMGGDEASAYTLISAFCNRTFRLDGGAPYIFCLLRGTDVNYLAFACHAALIDIFSLKPLFSRISDAYNGEPLPAELGFDQEALVAEEARTTTGPGFHESIRFWLQMVQDTSFEWHPPRLEDDLNDHYSFLVLDPERTSSLQRAIAELNIPLQDLVLFCFHLFLMRMTRNETVLTTYRHRIRSSPAGTIGFNENKPAFKSVLDPDMSLRRTFRQAARLLAQTRFHADIPAREIARELARREPEFRRVTNVQFCQDPLPYGELTLDGVTATLLPVFSHRLETEDVAVYVDVREQVTFHLLTRSPQETSGLKMIFEHFLALLGNVYEDLDRPVRAVRLFDEGLQRRALALVDGGPLRGEQDDVWDRIAAVTNQQPDAFAVRFGARRLTYAELSLSARTVAAGLSTWVSSGEPLIGICLNRSERVVQAMLGVLAAGAGYVPLDPTMPTERLRFIMDDARLSAVIVESDTRALIEPLANCAICPIERLLDGADTLLAETSKNRPAYVIYTSGTTGQPKGVVVERGNLAYLLAAMQGVFERGPGTRWLQFAAFTFDASVLETFNPIAHGAELVIAPSEARTDPEALFRLLSEARVTHAGLPPALLPLLPRRPLDDLKVIFCGGEAIDEETARFWSKAVDLANLYGPTEATVLATMNSLKGYKAATHLGRPIPGYQTWLLEDSGELAMLGGVGEICIGGGAVARGYLGRPQLTSQKFIPNPYGAGRLYRTGDLARFLPNGDLEFLGRSDFQVKIRGFRIELGDIENAIAQQPEVNGAHVGVLKRDGVQTLVAWYVGSGLDADTLRSRLAGRLPNYMIPACLMRIEAFPLTVNGKIDRARLPAPSSTDHSADAESLDDLQTRVRAVWASVLRLSPTAIGLDSNFFHLGGHSLVAAQACNRLSLELGTSVRPKALFECPVFDDFCERVRSSPQSRTTLPRMAARGLLQAPVDSRLIGLIYSRSINRPGDNTYNIVSRIEFSAPIEAERLQQALTGLLSENPIFGAAFHEEAGQLVVKAERQTPDIAIQDEGDAEAMRAECLGISVPPLWRAQIVRTPEGVVLLFNVHHALFDGWSLNMFMEELAVRYERGRFDVPRRTWFDYCHWSRVLPTSQPWLDSIAYWRRKLSGAEARIELPADPTHKGPNANAALRLRFEPATVKALRQLADQQGMTMPPLLFSLYLVWLWRLSNQEELIVGYPYAGRDIPGTEEIYGTFVTMGFLRQAIDPVQPWADLALAVHRQMIDDKEHLVAAPYDAEIANMDTLNVIFSLQTGISLEGELCGATYKAEELPSLTSKADLAGIFYEARDGAIEGRIEYDGSQFQAQAMERFARVFGTLVESAATHPLDRIEDLTYERPEDLARFLDLAAGPRLDTPDSTIPERFALMAATWPTKTAVVFGDRRLSYRALDDISDEIAASVRRHASPGSFVGLSMGKSEMAVAAVFGILKAGCTYVPLDPSYPTERLRYFVENCQVRVAVADAASRELLPDLTFIDPMGPSEPGPSRARVSPDGVAYVIHTSGSTGKPKGVLIEHRAVVRMIEASAPAMYYDADCSSTLIASLSFDTSVLELFLPLLTGGTLHVVPEAARKDPMALARVLRHSGATHVIVSPVMLQNLPREPIIGLRLLGFGGDAIDADTADWWSRQTRLFSLYGPTEITVQCSVGEILPGANARIIGKPLAGYRVYLLNRQRQAVPEGVSGEICIGGSGLARGYLNLDGLTHERFVLDPFAGSPYASMYLTGDLGRMLDDGTIEFIGRNDAQIKLRGFRIELGEIENSLSTCPGIRHAVCSARGEGDGRYLAAYYVSDEALQDEALRRHLAGFLPEYMIPSFFVRLPHLPVSPNGKVDRKALPDVSRPPAEHPPLPGLETSIARVWEDVLHLRGPGRDESFFHLGGNSLLAVRLQAELRQRLGLDISIAEFYGAPTIEALASGRTSRYIQVALDDATRDIDRADTNPAPLRAGPPRSALLTGAGGFLGIFLLAELCRRVPRVHCLLRSGDMEFLTRKAQEAGVVLDPSRIEIVLGNLDAPGLGLSPEALNRLATDVDLIVHCGAFVHHLHGYQSMRAANVEGTRELLRLAQNRHLKRFCFISTLTVAFAVEGATVAAEAVLPNPPVVDNGYILTKWVGEQLAARASVRYGIPTVIARPGNITGSRTTGYTNYANNHFWLFNKGCLQLGVFPDVPVPVEMMPVDLLAEAIVALALAQDHGLRVANLNNPTTLPRRDFVASLSSDAVCRPPAEWQTLLARVGEDNALAKLKDLYRGDLSGAPPPVEQAETLATLSACGVRLETDYAALIPIYLEYLRSAGFLSPQPKPILFDTPSLKESPRDARSPIP